MKNLFLILTAFSILQLAGCADKPTWTALSLFDGGAAYYITPSNDDQVKDASLSGSLRWVYEHPQRLKLNDGSEVTYSSKEATVLINCATHTFTLPDYSFHDASKVVHWVSEAPEHIKWLDIKSNATVFALIEKLDRPSCAQ